MTITVEATYENGSLKLSKPLPLAEHEKVRVTVEAQPAEALEVLSDSVGSTELSIGEQIAAMARALPPEVFEGLPTDGASQHDHYIYGTPKRTDLRDKPE